MIYAYIKADGARQQVESEGPLGLERLQQLVGGYIEFLDLPDGTTLCINEEGLLCGLPRNEQYPMVVGDVVVGRNRRGREGTEFVGLL